ncbi:trigger factor [Acidobacteria bacterium AH-259-D05]|nr:trigger factor [Acidobacteria bacterium AH-259-D05]
MDIRVELEHVSTVKKRLKVEVPAGIALKEWDQVAGQYKQQVRLPGFRPGKAPVELIKRRFRKNIRSDVLQKLIPDSYDQAIREKGVDPIGEPSLENLTFEEGQPLVYEANFEVHPHIELPQYRGLKVTVESKSLTPEDIDEELNKLRETHSRLVSVDNRPIEEGDYVVVDLHGEYLEEEEAHDPGEPFQEENVVIHVGDEHTHEAFNKALMGASAGEEKEFRVEYASDYPEQKLAGHKLLFTVKVSEIKQKELPELNDELAKDVGDYETLEGLREELKERLSAERERNREIDLGNKLLDQLVASTSFEVPEILIENRIDGMLRDLAFKMASQGLDPSKANVDWMKVRADFRPDAEKQVRANMTLSEIGRREEIEISTQELEQEVEQMAGSMEQPKEKVRQYFQQENRMEGLKTQLIRKKVLKILLESAEVDDN